MLRRGHAGGHLLAAFENYVDSHSFEEKPGWDQMVEIDEEKRPIRWLIGQLWNCMDIMPGSLCENLGLSEGSTYAQGVRFLWSDLAA